MHPGCIIWGGRPSSRWASLARQIFGNRESSALQYAMRDRLAALRWSHIETADDDLGHSAAGGVTRAGFDWMVTDVCLDKVGAVGTCEMSRFARNSRPPAGHRSPAPSGTNQPLGTVLIEAIVQSQTISRGDIARSCRIRARAAVVDRARTNRRRACATSWVRRATRRACSPSKFHRKPPAF